MPKSLPVNADSRSVTAGAAAERGGSGAVRRPHRADPGALARRELVVARVVRVVHVVVDRVQTRQRAGVPAGRAATARAALGRSVGDLVVGRRTTALEGVV